METNNEKPFLRPLPPWKWYSYSFVTLVFLYKLLKNNIDMAIKLEESFSWKFTRESWISKALKHVLPDTYTRTWMMDLSDNQWNELRDNLLLFSTVFLVLIIMRRVGFVLFSNNYKVVNVISLLPCLLFQWYIYREDLVFCLGLPIINFVLVKYYPSK